MIAACDVCISPSPATRSTSARPRSRSPSTWQSGDPSSPSILQETRRTAGDAAAYAARDDPAAFADAIDALLDDAPLRERMGASGRDRAKTALGWDTSEEALLAAYASALDQADRRRSSG